MGLAASQCRLLLLTARLSDTEYRAQMISQRRMQLAMQTEQIATDYARAMRNRSLYHVYDLDGNQVEVFREQLNYDTLTCESRFGGGQFRVVLADGRIAVPTPGDIPGFVSKKDPGSGKTSYAEITTANIDAYLKSYVGDNEEVKKYLGGGLTAQQYAELADILKSDDSFQSLVLSTDPVDLTMSNGYSSSIIGSDGQEYVVIPALNNSEYFQNAIRTGGIYVERYDKNNYTDNDGWSSYDIIDSPYVRDNLNTADDDAARAEYESKSAIIQSQDKQLEIELKQVETQHQAAQTEYDSVKKVIDKNIERSFKTFG